MNRLLRFCDCRSWADFAAMLGCLVLLPAIGALLISLPVMSPLWWPA